MHPSLQSQFQSGPLPAFNQFTSVSATMEPPIQEEVRLNDERKKKLLERAKEDFATVCAAEAEWRQRATAELKFCDELEHWTEQQKAERAGKPCLEFDQITGKIDQVINNARQNPPEARIAAVGSGKSAAKARMVQALVRNINNDSDAIIGWMTAYRHAVKIGRGWVAVDFDFEDDEDHPFWQRLMIRAVNNWASIYPDPAAMEYDYSDARFLFETEDVDEKVFLEQNPGAKGAPSDIEWSSTSDPVMLQWYPKKGCIRVANYWYIVETQKTLYQLPTGETVEENPGPGQWRNKRTKTIRKVHCARMTGSEVLKEWIHPGKRIPRIPVIGKEEVIEGKRKIRGMIRAAKDPNLAYDYARSKEIEVVALSPVSQWSAPAAAIEGFESEYADSNRRTIGVLKYHQWDEDGRELRPPIRISPSPASQAAAVAVDHANEDIMTSTSTWDANMGSPGPEQSGKAIGMRQRQADNAHFNYADNLAASVRSAARVILDLIPSVYSEERAVMVMDPDGKQRSVIINGETTDPKTGEKVIYDLNDATARYEVTISTGPAYQSLKSQQVEQVLEVGRTAPGSMQAVLDLFSNLLDLPEEFSERWRPPSAGPKAGDEQPSIGQLQQLLAQQSQLIQALTEKTQMMAQDIAAKKVESDSRERIAYEGNQTQIAIAALKAAADKELELMRSQFASLEQRLNLLHDSHSQMAARAATVERDAAAKQQEQQAGAQPPAKGVE